MTGTAPIDSGKGILMDDTFNTIELATELTIAWLGNPNTRADADAVPAFLQTMYAAVTGLATAPFEPAVEPPATYTPAISARKSLSNKDHIISMIDGKPYRTLRRHLSTHGMTPDEYRERYGLKADYPMVAENYSEERRAMAKRIGLGRKRSAVAAPAEVNQAPKRRGPKPQTVPAA